MEERSNTEIIRRIETESVKRRWFVQLTLGVIICLSMAGVGCLSGAGIDVSCSTDADADAFLENLNVTDPEFRFEYPGHTELTSSNGFWFSGGDITAAHAPTNPLAIPIVFGLNGVNFELRERQASDTCVFNGQGGCYRCDLCVNGLASCNNGTNPSIVNTSQSLLTLSEIDKNTSAERVLFDFPDPGDACFMRPDNAGFGSFLPEKSAFITLKKNHPCGASEALAQFETTVVNTPEVYYAELEAYHDTTDPGVVRFSFTMDLAANGKLDQNFSPDLRVTKVQVVEDVFNNSTMAVDHGETPDALKRMLPSRILFLPSFNPGNVNDFPEEATNRCYVDASVADGNFDLFRNCRKDPNSSELQSHEVTPTYINRPGLRNLLVTWIIEYKVSDGLPELPNFSLGRPGLKFLLEEVQQ